MYLYFLYVVTFIIITGFSATFVSAEYALTAIEPSIFNSTDTLSSRKKIIFSLIRNALKHLSYSLSSVQLGITLTTIASGVLASKVFGEPIIVLLHYWQITINNTISSVIVVISTILATTINIIFGELIPKNYAVVYPERTVEKSIGVIWIFSRIFSLIIRFFDVLAHRLVKLLGISAQENLSSARSVDELAALVNVTQVKASSRDDLNQIVYRSLQFGVRTAEELMTPRSQVETIDKDASASELIELAQTTGHSKFPVIDGDFDDTIGAIHIKQVLALSAEERIGKTMAEMCKPITKIPISLAGDEVMDIIRESIYSITLVVDEYGGNAGIVTFEDLIEEIVGEVHDEYDINIPRISQIGDSYEMSGLLRLHEVIEETGFHPCEGEYETIAGAVMSFLGAIPQIGDRVLIPDQRAFESEDNEHDYDPWMVVVNKMDGFRIETLTLSPPMQLNINSNTNLGMTSIENPDFDDINSIERNGHNGMTLLASISKKNNEMNNR